MQLLMYNTIKSIINHTIMSAIVPANDIKTKGVKALDKAIKADGEAVITVRGKDKYVVMTKQRYVKLREAELEAALIESERDIASGDFETMTPEEHLKSLDNV